MLEDVWIASLDEAQIQWERIPDSALDLEAEQEENHYGGSDWNSLDFEIQGTGFSLANQSDETDASLEKHRKKKKKRKHHHEHAPAPRKGHVAIHVEYQGRQYMVGH